MEPYRNLSGQSGVVAYKLGQDDIIVQFRSGRHTFYRYSASSVGDGNVQHMHQLATVGQGLNAFISSNQNIKDGYDRRGNSLADM